MPTSKLRSKPVERHTLADQVYASLKKGILDGDLHPGERLKEVEIATSLGASRTPVREALSRLEQEGLVQPLSSGGLTVVELSPNDVEEIFGLLKVVESYAIRLAAERVTERQLERLKSLCARAEQLYVEDIGRLIELNRRFHEMLIDMADHRRLKALVGDLRTALQPYRIVTIMSPDFQRAGEFRDLMVNDHSEIVKALGEGNVGRLVKLVQDHNDLAKRITLRHVWG
jgi:DNA-binding GntR family transcriptional regulator